MLERVLCLWFCASLSEEDNVLGLNVYLSGVTIFLGFVSLWL